MSYVLTVDSLSEEPLYKQLREAVVVAIESGLVDRGELLPSSRALAADLGLSRNTVNSAYVELVAEGFLESIDRVGYIVNRELQSQLAVERRDTRSEPDQIDWEDRLATGQDASHRVVKPRDWLSQPYPFVTGQPDLSAFPLRQFTRAVKRALDPENTASVFNDMIDRDDARLVELLCKRILPRRGITAGPSQVLITLGSQHGIRLVGEALLDSASVVAIEDPGFPDARHIFQRLGAELRPVKVDSSGMVIPSSLHDVDLVFTTPSHQYPTQRTLSIGRRRRLLTRASMDDSVIIEDDYDSEFRYQGRVTPALKALDTTGRVIYLGSFSKFLGPGLRLGFIVADPVLIERMRDIRRDMLRHPPGLIQATVADLIATGDYATAVARTRKALKAKWDAITGAVEHHFPFPVDFPTGGVSLWISGPPDLDARELTQRAYARGIVIEPGGICFLANPPPNRHFRLGFGAIGAEAIEPGVRRLAGLIEEML